MTAIALTNIVNDKFWFIAVCFVIKKHESQKKTNSYNTIITIIAPGGT